MDSEYHALKFESDQKSALSRKSRQAFQSCSHRTYCPRGDYRWRGCAHLLRCIPRVCRPRSVMTYNVFRSLCGCFVTYCTSTKRTSPVLEANALTMRPRSPAARNAFKNQNLVSGQIDGHSRPDL